MTILDMICLADMWISLSGGSEGNFVHTIVLPGVLTGRSEDRYFKCTPLSTMPGPGDSEWGDFLQAAVDHMDFQEIKKEDFTQCSLESVGKPDLGKTQ